MTDMKAPYPLKYTGLTPIVIPSYRERNDNYQGIIVQLDPRWRIIECRDAIQWIIQKRSAEPSHSGEWRGDSCSVTRRPNRTQREARIALRPIKAGCAGGVAATNSQHARHSMQFTNGG